jgi:hypothetical protein
MLVTPNAIGGNQTTAAPQPRSGLNKFMVITHVQINPSMLLAGVPGWPYSVVPIPQ